MLRRPYIVIIAALFSVSAAAASRVSPPLDREPPAPIYEVEQPERPGYIWAPGCWKWDGKRLVWGAGRWLAKRPGYTWVPDGWEQRADKWYYAQGYWEEDGSAVAETVDTPPPVDDVAEATPAKPKVKKKRAPKPIDYSDKRIWTRVIQH